MENVSRSGTGSPRHRKRRGILQGLDTNKILTPPPSNLSDKQPRNRKPLNSEKHTHATRQKIRGARLQKEANYDAKFHPMDKIHKARLEAHRRRSTDNQLKVITSLNVDGEEELTDEGDGIDQTDEADDEAELACEGIYQSGDDESMSSDQDPYLSPDDNDFEEVHFNPVLFGHPLPEGSRQSLRLHKQTIERPIYSMKVHPQDFNIPFHHQAARRKFEEDKRIAKKELNEASKRALSRKGKPSKAGMRPSFGFQPMFLGLQSPRTINESDTITIASEIPESPSASSDDIGTNTEPRRRSTKYMHEQMVNGLFKSLSTPSPAPSGTSPLPDLLDGEIRVYGAANEETLSQNLDLHDSHPDIVQSATEMIADCIERNLELDTNNDKGFETAFSARHSELV